MNIRVKNPYKIYRYYYMKYIIPTCQTSLLSDHFTIIISLLSFQTYSYNPIANLI